MGMGLGLGLGMPFVGSSGGTILSRYLPGGVGFTHTRASVATYTENASDLFLTYSAGDSLAASTETRGSVATYTESA